MPGNVVVSFVRTRTGRSMGIARITIRGLWFVVFAISICLAIGRESLLGVFTFCIPVVLGIFLATTQWRVLVSRLRDRRWTLMAGMVGIAMAIGMFLAQSGFPQNGHSYIVLCSAWPLVVYTSLLPATYWRETTVTTVLGAALAALFCESLRVAEMIDPSSGRRGTLYICDVLVGGETANSRIVEQYVGRRASSWRKLQQYYSRDGDDRVNSQVIVFSPRLQEALVILRDEEAITTALSCVSDSRNYLRIHQSMLLKCAAAYDKRESAAEPWWSRHRAMFVRVHSRVVAKDRVRELEEYIDRTYGYLIRESRLHDEMINGVKALEYQREGLWGGDGI